MERQVNICASLIWTDENNNSDYRVVWDDRRVFPLRHRYLLEYEPRVPRLGS